MKRDMLRIVAISDTHGLHRELPPLPEGDILLHGGDITNLGELPILEDFVAFLDEQPHRHKVVIAGNHDWCCAREEERPRAEELLRSAATYLLDEAVTIEGLLFYGSPWQPWFLDWAFNLRRGPELAAKWAQIPDDTDVLLTHGPPARIGDRCFDERRVGCEDLLARIAEVEPLLHVFGHIHEAAGIFREGDVTYVNASCLDVAAGPAVIDIDITTRRVLHAERLPPARR